MPSSQPLRERPKTSTVSSRTVERRQWWLASSGVLVTLVLTLGIASFALPIALSQISTYYPFDVNLAARALVGLVLLFDVYIVYQQRQIHLFRLQLTQREELFRIISENAADLIALVDTKGQRLYNSPSYEKLLGYSPEELARTSAFDQIHPDDREKVRAAANQAQFTGQGRPVEYRIRHKDGHWLNLESTASVVRDDQGMIQKLVIVNRDITERKQLEQQLYLSQKLEAIGRLSGGVAHDFNNLLGVIIGYSEALQDHIPEDDPFREPVDEIQKAGNRAAALTQQLLAFSRKQVLAPVALDLRTVITDLEKMLRRLIGEDIDLQIELPQKLGTVTADRGQIEQVILNLAVNARDAMPQGGRLAIEVCDSELTQSDVARYCYAKAGPYVMLKVTDSGCGMDAELQSHIFEPFFTTKEKGKGTGLGLATVYGVIKQSGGYIWVDSEPGKGSTFRIYLPESQGRPDIPSEEKRSTKIVPAASRTILLVEDEQSLRKLTRTILTAVGYIVLEADDAIHAVQISTRTDGAIDLLLTDVVMPGMSGRELADEISPRRPTMKVLYMSGYNDGFVAERGVARPGASVLHKPFTREELLRRVSGALEATAPVSV